MFNHDALGLPSLCWSKHMMIFHYFLMVNDVFSCL